MRDQFGRVLAVGAIGESLPNARSYIDLDPEEKDGAGMPKARINSHLDDTELTRLRFMANKAREILHAAGASQLVEEYGTYDVFSSTHVFGTCRMGKEAAKSVVDSHCRSHRWRNLMVVDASVFPSSGGGEAPSLSIAALALRAAQFAAAQAGG
jgi:choline dehydrogenase-like flavoprotein